MPQISSRPSRYKLNSWIMVDENPGPFRSRFFFGDAIKWNNHLFFHTRDLWFAKVRNRTRLCFRFIYFSPLLEFWDPTWLLRQMLSTARNQVACSSFRIDFVGNARERSKGEKVYLPWENDPFRKFSETFLALSSQRCWKAFSDDFPMFSQRKEFVYLSILGNRIALEFKVPIARIRRSKNGPRRVSRIENDFLSLGGPGSKTPTKAFLNMSWKYFATFGCNNPSWMNKQVYHYSGLS